MNSYFRKLILAGLLVMTLLPAFAKAEKSGPETGGGGNAIYQNDQFVLLDFFNFKSIHQIKTSAAKIHFEILNAPLYEHPDMLKPSIEKLFRSWGVEVDPLGVNHTSKIQSLTFSLRQYELKAFELFRPEYLAPHISIYQAARYSTNTNSVDLSHVIWSRMDRINKLGLVIHEQLRYLQFGLNYKFNDEFLQKTTVMLLTCKPKNDNLFLLFLLAQNPDSTVLSEIDNKIQSCIVE